MVAIILVLVLVFVVMAVITSPWRRLVGSIPVTADHRVRTTETELEDLEATRDAKYREIRDAELDRQTGKLSDADFNAVDSALRAEAIEILKQLDQVRARLEKLRNRAAEEAGTPQPDTSATAASEDTSAQHEPQPEPQTERS